MELVSPNTFPCYKWFVDPSQTIPRIISSTVTRIKVIPLVSAVFNSFDH